MFFALSPFLLVEPLTALPRHRRQPPDRGRSRGRVRRVRARAARYAECCGTTRLACRSIVLRDRRHRVDARSRLAAVRVLLLAFPVPFLLFIANTSPASRYLNPVLPFVALFAAWLLARAGATLGDGRRCSGLAVDRSPLSRRPGEPCRIGLLLPAGRHADAGARAHRVADSRRRDHPDAAVLGCRSTMSRPALEEALTVAPRQHRRPPRRKFQLQLGLTPYPAPAYRLVYLGIGGLDVDKLYVSIASEVSGAGRAGSPLRRLGVAFVVLQTVQ